MASTDALTPQLCALAMRRSALGDGAYVYRHDDDIKQIGIILGGDENESVVLFLPNDVSIIANVALRVSDDRVVNVDLSKQANQILHRIMRGGLRTMPDVWNLLSEITGAAVGGEGSIRYYARCTSPLGDRSYVRIAGELIGFIMGGDAVKTAVATRDDVALYATSSLQKIDETSVSLRDRALMMGRASMWLAGQVSGEITSRPPQSAPAQETTLLARIHALELRVHDLECERDAAHEAALDAMD